MKGILKVLGAGIVSIVMIGIFVLPALAQAPVTRRFKMNMLIDMSNEKYDYDKGPERKLTGYDILGGVGFFMGGMFEVGPEISYGQFKMTDKSGIGIQNTESKVTQWAIGAKVNAHFNPTGKVCPYIGANLGFANREWELDKPSNNPVGGCILDRETDDDTAMVYGVQAGLDYFLADSVSLNPELRYTMGKFSYKADDADYTNLSLMIGLAFHM